MIECKVLNIMPVSFRVVVFSVNLIAFHIVATYKLLFVILCQLLIRCYLNIIAAVDNYVRSPLVDCLKVAVVCDILLIFW